MARSSVQTVIFSAYYMRHKMWRKKYALKIPVWTGAWGCRGAGGQAYRSTDVLGKRGTEEQAVM